MPVKVVLSFLFTLFLVVQPRDVTAQPGSPELIDEIEACARIPSVTGRELDAVRFIRSRLGDLPAFQDALGNLTVTLGSGEPRRLFAAPLDEPGYVVSRIGSGVSMSGNVYTSVDTI